MFVEEIEVIIMKEPEFVDFFQQNSGLFSNSQRILVYITPVVRPISNLYIFVLFLKHSGAYIIMFIRMKLFSVKPERHLFRYRLFRIFILPLIFLFSPFLIVLTGQTAPDVISGDADLNTCLSYAMKHQPLVRQLQLNEEISRRDVGIALSDWLPQLDASANLQSYIKQPVSIFPDLTNPGGPEREITIGQKNTSSLQFSASQVIYNNSVLIAGKTAKYYRLKSSQSTEQSKIDLVVEVSKAFYDVLLSKANLNFLKEDMARMNKSMQDAYSQYQAGVSDKIDYQRATIALNNTRAEITGTEEDIKAKYAYLKELMGYPVEKPLSIAYDSLKMIQESLLDTTTGLDYQNRIEYQLLKTNLSLQKSAVDYYKLGFLPSLSAFGDYNMVYQNNNFSDLYGKDYPNSYIGLKLSFPLFDGTKRIQEVKRASLQYREMALDTLNLKSRMNTQYQQAMASYKSNLKNYDMAQKNAGIADDVYNTVKLQYDQGIKTYLEVIVSETDLRTSRINELNALYRLLSSKLDVEKALGNISVNY